MYSCSYSHEYKIFLKYRIIGQNLRPYSKLNQKDQIKHKFTTVSWKTLHVHEHTFWYMYSCLYPHECKIFLKSRIISQNLRPYSKLNQKAQIKHKFTTVSWKTSHVHKKKFCQPRDCSIRLFDGKICSKKNLTSMLCHFYIRIGENYADPAPVELYRKSTGNQECKCMLLSTKD